MLKIIVWFRPGCACGISHITVCMSSGNFGLADMVLEGTLQSASGPIPHGLLERSGNSAHGVEDPGLSGLRSRSFGFYHP